MLYREPALLLLALHRTRLLLLLALGKNWAVTLEVTVVMAVAALSAEKGGTDDLAVRTGAVLDEVAGVALLLQPRVEADLAEGLPWLALSWAGSTASPCRAGFNPSVVLGTLWAAGAIAVPTLLGNDGESKRGHDETGKTRRLSLNGSVVRFIRV